MSYRGINSMGIREEFMLQRENLKKNIQILIESNKLDDAKAVIDVYEKIINRDVEIYSFKAIIAMMENKKEEAQELLLSALDLNPNNVDILYNLGFLYESIGEYIKAFIYYKKAKSKTEENHLLSEINNALDRLENYPSVQRFKLNKKVLVIAYIFPPLASSGVQRTLKFVKYLRNFGWEPIVVTVKEEDSSSIFRQKDNTFFKEIPEDTQIIRIDMPTELTSTLADKTASLIGRLINKKDLREEFEKTVQEYRLVNVLLRPDKYILWANNVIEQIEKYVSFDDIDMIYSTSAPYSDHIAAYFIKQRYQKPWIADFRDEWTNNCYADYDKKSIIYRLEYAMEEKIVQYADRILTTTPVASDNYRNIFKLDYNKVITITNGYDEDDFLDIKIENDNEKFTMIHNGLLYSVRTPDTFFRAVSNLLKKGLIDKDKFKIYMGLTQDDEHWKQLANELGLGSNIEFTGYMTHNESLHRASKVDALLLIVGEDERVGSMYPGKIFEYLRLGKEILSLSPIGGVVDKLIKELDRGFNVEFQDVESIEQAFFCMYQNWINNRKKTYALDDKIKQYERRVLTEKLANLFNSVYVEFVEMRQRKKIAFFSIPGGDKFLQDIIHGLSKEYYTRNITVYSNKDIEEGMKWADICWFEWCDDVVAVASNLDLAKERTIICRIHRYEVFTNNPKKVNWNNVDKLILVTGHLKALLRNLVPDIEEKTEIEIIQNGVNMDKFTFKPRKKGFNVAFIGYMIPRKNPMLLLQIAKKLVEKDPRYKIYCVGHFNDELLKYYWYYQIQEMKLENNLIFEGFQPNINEWLEDKNYIISTTMHESFGYGIAEAMARGIKPVIHNFLCSKEIWDDKYLFNTIDEAVEKITSDDYNSKEYREYISSNYSLEKQLMLTKNLIKDMLMIKYIKEVFNELVPYNYEYVDNYNFSDGFKILIGKREEIRNDIDLIECIIENSSKEKLLLLNIWHNKNKNNIELPDYLSNSKNVSYIRNIVDEIISLDLKHINKKIKGFTFDKNLKEDIEKNFLAYQWERNLPATQFMSSSGYLAVAARYLLAAKYINKGDLVLEAASGFGYGAAYLSKIGCRVKALDISQENIEFGRSVYNFTNIDWVQGDVINLPFDNDTFDMYVSFETLEHIALDQVFMYLEEAYRVLKLGGKLIISTPNIESRRDKNNPFHVKEYNFTEFDEILRHQFSNICYYSVVDNKVEHGMNNNASVMIAVCEK